MKRTTRATIKKGKTRPGNKSGSVVYERKFKTYVGVNSKGKKTKKVRVVKQKNGRFRTSFPY